MGYGKSGTVKACNDKACKDNLCKGNEYNGMECRRNAHLGRNIRARHLRTMHI
jgi:hypothetical protein